MTPSQLEESARRRYNAIGDTYFTQAEILDYIYHAECELCRDGFVIQNTYTASTVASQQAYSWPTQAIAIKRITYDGAKLAQIDMREDDSVTQMNQVTTSTGTPAYYFLWEKSIYLRPVPAGVGTLKIFTYDRPQTVSITSVLDVPEDYHTDLIYFVLAEMALKDGNQLLERRYRDLWLAAKQSIVKVMRRRLRGDGPAHVKDIDTLPMSGIGTV